MNKKILEQYLELIASAKSDLIINRKINSKMNRKLFKLANDQAKWEIIQDVIKQWKPRKYSLNKGKIDGSSPKDVIYIVGDVHYRGAIDEKIVINVFSQIKSEIKQRKYKNVTLILTGDNIDGEIHEEQTRTNEPVIDATLQITNLYVNLINQIPNIKEVYMVYGNHEEIRLWGDKNTKNNVGKFIYYGLKTGLKYANVYAGDELRFQYKDKEILLLHGHQNYAKSKTKLIDHCATKYKYQPDYIIIGHFHTSKANQFSKNQWLITAPALKDWESDWDSNNGYCGLGQYIKLKLNFDTPQITTLNIKEK